MGTYTKNLKLETPSYTDNADIPALTKKNNEIIDSEMIKRANGLDYNEQTGVLQLTGNNSKVGSPIQIKNNLPVTSMASGTELKVNNYKQLIKFTKEGKTEQKTYTGKNLLNYVDNLQSISGLTNTINSDGSITTTGKPTANFTRIVKDYDITNLLEDGQKYTISQTDTSLKTMLQITAYKNDGTITYYSSRNGANVLTINKSIYTKFLACVQTTSMSLWGDESLTINNKYMLCKGTDTADTSFEPYVGGQASPNPDYPQLIKNIKGVENIWFGGESTTNNGITFTKNNDGSYDITGTAIASADCINLVNIANAKLKNGINYNLSINKLTNEKVSILTEAYIENWDSHVIGPLITSTTLSTNKIINIKDNITRVRYVIRVEKGQTVNIKGLKIQLEEGTVVHDFVQNGSNYLQLENKSKNILPHSLSQGSWNTTSTNTRVANYSNILIKPGTYTFSTDIDLTNYVVWVGTSTQKLPHLNWNIINEIKSWSAIEKITFTIEKESYFLVMYRKKDDSTITPDEIKNIKQQLKIGSEAGEFEPYQKKIINIDLKGNNLCSNKDETIKDELLVENGKAKINKKIKEVVLTGNESITRQTTLQSNKYRFNITCDGLPSISSDVIPDLLCSHFKPTNRTNTYNCINGIALGQNIVQVYDDTLSSMSEDEFKAKLKSLYAAGTPVKVQYELAEPKVIDLGEVDFDLIENSTLTCEEESNMQIDYLTISSNIFVQDSLDGNSSQKAPSIDAIKKYFGKKVYDKDANGWIKIEFFDHIEYVYTTVVNKTFNSGWGYTDNVPFPVGVSSLGDRILTSSVICTDAAIKLNAGQYHNGKQGIGINYTNSYETALTKECIYDFRILEYK